VFALVTYILEGGYDDAAYPHMGGSPIIITILQTFRNAVGDITEPGRSNWVPKALKNSESLQNEHQIYILAVTWFFFIANIFIMQIVLLNFLIAEVSMTYDRIKNTGPSLMFQKKQELNFFVQKVLQFFGRNNQFKALIFIS